MEHDPNKIRKSATNIFVYPNESNVQVEQAGYPILGETLLSPLQMDHFVKKVNPDAPELGDYYLNISKFYGIRGDIAFAQAIHETDYFRFTGVVKPEQNNYAGIGPQDQIIQELVLIHRE